MIERYHRDVSQSVIERVRARDAYCQICGGVRQDVHHIRSRGSGGADEQSNLIGLCRVCHTRAHTGEISREQLYAALGKYGFEMPN